MASSKLLKELDTRKSTSVPKRLAVCFAAIDLGLLRWPKGIREQASLGFDDEEETLSPVLLDEDIRV